MKNADRAVFVDLVRPRAGGYYVCLRQGDLQPRGVKKAALSAVCNMRDIDFAPISVPPLGSIVCSMRFSKRAMRQRFSVFESGGTDFHMLGKLEAALEGAPGAFWAKDGSDNGRHAHGGGRKARVGKNTPASVGHFDDASA